MKIYNRDQIRSWDQYTIENEPISSIDLMERAAAACVIWITNRAFKNGPFTIFCGKGNNGGDGLAIARLLLNAGVDVSIYIIETGKKGSTDFELNLKRLQHTTATINYINNSSHFPKNIEHTIIIDALFGSGLDKPLSGLPAELVHFINAVPATCLSIDLPSGLFMDKTSLNNSIVKADHTLTFQGYKLSLLVAENASYIGEVHVLDIKLHPQYEEEVAAPFELIDVNLCRTIFRKRPRFAHKGDFGHSLIIGGSYGKVGASVLAVSACLHSGAGLVTAYIPKCAYTIMQLAVPEAMAITDTAELLLSNLPDINKYNAIGVGPGIGTESPTQQMIIDLVQQAVTPLVLDADALNCLALHSYLLQQLPPYSIITPHPKEFDRLFGEHKSDFDRIATAQQKAAQLKLIIVLKGHHTFIATPGGKAYFNNTGNAGMAKGGSGDVLTGIITSFLGQKYTPLYAALLGVYLHGMAGDFAAEALSKETMTASDIITHLTSAFRYISES